MADLRRSMRDLFLQGVEAVNSAANHVASATRSKVDELNLRNRRKEMLDQLANAVYEQWQQGLQLPDALTETLAQIRDIDAQLAEMASQPEKSEAPASDPKEEAAAPTMALDEEDVPDEAPAEQAVPTIQVDEPAPTDSVE